MNVHITNKKAVRFVLIAVMMIFLIVGVVLVCSGLWFKNYDKGVKERCTESVQAIVDGYQSSSSRHSDGTYSTSYNVTNNSNLSVPMTGSDGIFDTRMLFGGMFVVLMGIGVVLVGKRKKEGGEG